MTNPSKNWKEIDRLLDQVLEVAPEKRAALLNVICAGDPALRVQIEKLIKSEQSAGDFFDFPILNSNSSIGPETLISMLSQSESDGRIQPRQLIANRYEILSRLGKGGMGEVWHAYDLKLQIDVALKSIRQDFIGNENALETLRREVRSAREVISENVCRIFDLVVDENLRLELISMEYVDGSTLADLLAKGPLPITEAKDVATQFLTGLEAIHKAGLVHRDLKPENIMITRTGRVVVMDFGISEQSHLNSGSTSGTFPYMSPEQLQGAIMDKRGDIFAAGVVLAEMIYTKGAKDRALREMIWKTIHEDPMQLPDSSWKSVILRAVATQTDHRFQTAGAMSRSLEAVTERILRIEEYSPYPGLASFSSADSEYFFGRELEIEAAIKKLKKTHMMGLIGSSGAGKTSFLRAGLMPNFPPGWGALFCIPGDSPEKNLLQALVHEVKAGKNPALSLQMLRQWRNKYREGVLIIDRFEELFTLNHPETQSSFATLIGHATMECDVRVLISMRDDFLIRCQDYPELYPIFSEVMPMPLLSGTALRRALVQPAFSCGYRFENEEFVDRILADVEKERGALPLMAFTAARLWGRRDRTSGEIPAKIYSEIGGISGALARHAEETMVRIGSNQHAIVQEIFRNLVTAQHTRLARDAEELLSVFEDKVAAEKVLLTLIDARLLNSFEAAGNEGEAKRRRVEIIHESLLSAWPRLVRWQTQDADSAQLRDQLRQAADLWEQRGRTEDLLWTGTSFLEFQAWKERYSGGLTRTEESFSQAMGAHASRKRIRRQKLVFATIIVLLSVVAVITKLWRDSSSAKDSAVVQANRAEAGKILATGRALANADATTRLAYAIASLEAADMPQARRFALQALFQGPVGDAITIPEKPLRTVAFSPDGQWIAAGVQDGIKLYPLSGAEPITVSELLSENFWVPWPAEFSADSKLLLWTWRKTPGQIKVWSIPEKRMIRVLQYEGTTRCIIRAGKAFLFTDAAGNSGPPFGFKGMIVRSWNLNLNDEPQTIGKIDFKGGWQGFDVDDTGSWIGYVCEKGICIRSIADSQPGKEIIIDGAHRGIVHFRPGSNEIVISDRNGKIRFWSFPQIKNVRTIDAVTDQMWFTPDGSFLFTYDRVWNLEAPPSLEPYTFQHVDGTVSSIAIEPQNRTMAILGGSTLALYPLPDQNQYAFAGRSAGLRFTPDGKFFVTGVSDNGIRRDPMPATPALAEPVWEVKQSGAQSFDLDSTGTQLITAPVLGLHLISINDRKESVLAGLDSSRTYASVSFAPDGYSIAAVATQGIEVCNLQRASCELLRESKGKTFSLVKYSSDGPLFAAESGKVHRWNFKDGSFTSYPTEKRWISGLAVSKDGRYLATSAWDGPYAIDMSKGNSRVLLFDIQTGKTRSIASHGTRVYSLAFDPTGENLISGDFDGIVRVGSMSDATPHLLLGHEAQVVDAAVHPSGKWIGSLDASGIARLWRIPEDRPLDSLGHQELLNHLRSLTNVRVKPDGNSASGYRIVYGKSPGRN